MHDYGFSFDAGTVLMVHGGGCWRGSVVLLVMGARAAGLAMLGAVQGGVIATVASAITSGLPEVDLDAAWLVAAIGASIGAVVFGQVGLVWRPTTSRSTLRRLAVITAVVGALAVIALNAAAVPACSSPFRKDHSTCLDTNAPISDGFITGIWLPALVAFDAAFIGWLLLVQARQATASSKEKERVQADR
jgi:hypothetical protein